MYIEGKACWLNHLDAVMEKYNNRLHGTTKMTPFEMSINQKLIPNKRNNIDNKKFPKFQVGDFVRLQCTVKLFCCFSWNPGHEN